jgi:hypothetical protein
VRRGKEEERESSESERMRGMSSIGQEKRRGWKVSMEYSRSCREFGFITLAMFLTSLLIPGQTHTCPPLGPCSGPFVCISYGWATSHWLSSVCWHGGVCNECVYVAFFFGKGSRVKPRERWESG